MSMLASGYRKLASRQTSTGRLRAATIATATRPCWKSMVAVAPEPTTLAPSVPTAPEVCYCQEDQKVLASEFMDLLQQEVCKLPLDTRKKLQTVANQADSARVVQTALQLMPCPDKRKELTSKHLAPIYQGELPEVWPTTESRGVWAPHDWGIRVAVKDGAPLIAPDQLEVGDSVACVVKPENYSDPLILSVTIEALGGATVKYKDEKVVVPPDHCWVRSPEDDWIALDSTTFGAVPLANMRVKEMGRAGLMRKVLHKSSLYSMAKVWSVLK